MSDLSVSVKPKKQKAFLKKQREEELEDLKVVVSTPAGKRFVWKYLEFCGVFRLSFDSNDSHVSAFNEGRRNVGLALLSDMSEGSPEILLELLKNRTQTKED